MTHVSDSHSNGSRASRILGWPVAIVTKLARVLPDAELTELPWAGHLPSLERPLETAHLVRASLLD